MSSDSRPPNPDTKTASTSESENPAIPSPTPKSGAPLTNQDWWPNQIDVSKLHAQSSKANPMGDDFDYAKEFAKLDVEALKADVSALMTQSQDWWPADYGHYGGLFIRMSWHAAGTYRIHDGRGGGGEGSQRFAPLNSWPDNANLDKARRLLWPVKRKYGNKISWADLLVFAGNVALESMGFKTFGFGFGREDIWEPEEILFGEEDEWLGTNKRYSGERELAEPFGATTMGLIYVNPEGPEGKPDPLAAAHDIRETFGRMAMNDEETAALIVGGHSFGKTHGAGDADLVGPEPEAAPIEQQGLGWKCAFASGKARRFRHQRHRGGLDGHPDAVGQRLPAEPVRLRVGADQEPCRGVAVHHEGRRGRGHDSRPVRRPGPRTDDVGYGHLDAGGPDLRRDHASLAGPSRGAVRGLRQGLVQAVAPRHGTDHALPRAVGCRAAAVAGPRSGRRPGEPIDEQDVAALKSKVLESGLSVPQLVKTAWASAGSFRGTDKRGGANGARIRLEPQKNWEVNEPASWTRCCRCSRRSSRTSTAPRPAARRSPWPT